MERQEFISLRDDFSTMKGDSEILKAGDLKQLRSFLLSYFGEIKLKMKTLYSSDFDFSFDLKPTAHNPEYLDLQLVFSVDTGHHFYQQPFVLNLAIYDDSISLGPENSFSNLSKWLNFVYGFEWDFEAEETPSFSSVKEHLIDCFKELSKILSLN